MERYYSLNAYLRETFGEKLYKIALDGGFSCPNRDGSVGSGGCIFCSGAGSGDFAQRAEEDISSAIEAGKQRVAAKNPGGRYIAYFQSFTNTYGPIEKMRRLFYQAISHPDVAVLSIATRPDCLGDEVMALLRELRQIKPVWVELGLQTIHEVSARYIRRGYELPVYDEAVRKLKEAGIYVITHMIIGLPGETPEMIYDTARYIGASGSDGIKLQLLHVLENTDLAKDYRAGKFQALSLEEYLRLLSGCIERLPENICIHRLTGDGAKRELIAPLWSGDKKRVLNSMKKYFDENDVIQGKACR
ncbi:MAG: TIGR01212 family radical SAM protein [Oscillospiraceae bacterium]|nr:TIGR01212 family radical SAM protein [Oscillospiraceae bacterium]